MTSLPTKFYSINVLSMNIDQYLVKYGNMDIVIIVKFGFYINIINFQSILVTRL